MFTAEDKEVENYYEKQVGSSKLSQTYNFMLSDFNMDSGDAGKNNVLENMHGIKKLKSDCVNLLPFSHWYFLLEMESTEHCIIQTVAQQFRLVTTL